MGFELGKRIVVFESAGTSGTSAALNGPVIDFSGLEGAVGFAHWAATNASGYIKFQEGTASGSVSDTTGEVLSNFKTGYMDIFRPNKQFGRFVLRGTSTTGAYKSLHTIGYGPRSIPTTHAASTTGATFYSPSGGSATD